VLGCPSGVIVGVVSPPVHAGCGTP